MSKAKLYGMIRKPPRQRDTLRWVKKQAIRDKMKQKGGNQK